MSASCTSFSSDSCLATFGELGLSPSSKKRLELPLEDGKFRVLINHEKTFVFVEIKAKTRISKLFDRFAKKLGLDLSLLRFNFEGIRLRDDDTPDSLNMERYDEDGNANANKIDVNVLQVGGRAAR
ncbi:small ubiquitin-like modifier [Mycena crocata]|nr:small ubiquitin-like modifier [Mycena crocata]